MLLVTHVGRPEAVTVARGMATALAAAGLVVCVPSGELPLLRAAAVVGEGDEFPCLPAETAAGCELVVVVGGDGTILRAAEYAVVESIPLLGVNLGHVGFLAEAESDDVEHVVAAVLGRHYRVEERLALQVRVIAADRVEWSSWALNEASIEKTPRQRMIDVVVEIDERPLSQWGCDGVLVSSPTGSTAYAWSAGGPVVWPEVQALLVAPISAHALFARPLVVDHRCEVAVELVSRSPEAVLWCDGRRGYDLRPGCRVEVTSAPDPVRFARLHATSFTDRLVAKFHLPVAGWRGKRTEG